MGLWVGTFLKSKDFLKTTQNNDNLVAPPGEWNGKIDILKVATPSECNGKIVIKVMYYGPLANGTAVNKGLSLAISYCKPQNRSSISLTTLILLVLVGFVQFYRFFFSQGRRNGELSVTAEP